MLDSSASGAVANETAANAPGAEVRPAPPNAMWVLVLR